MLTSGTFPNQLKNARVIPIYKGGLKEDLSNWRPVSLVSKISKVFEKLLLSRFNSFIEKHNLIGDKQYGFKRNTGANEAIRDLTSTLYNNLDARKKCLLILLDLSNAFSSLPHSLLLNKMKKMGFRGVALSLVEDYLKDRPQTVKFNGVESPPILITDFSSPQGTVCSPTLFNLFINDILHLSLNGYVSVYADDTALLCWGDSMAELYARAKEDFYKIQLWLSKNGLTINKKKTVYLDFNKRGQGQFCIPEITRVNHAKYLRVILDEKLKWDDHCNMVTTKLRKTIYKFILLRQVVDRDTIKMIYFALVQPHLTYGILAWGGSGQVTSSK